MSHWGIPQERGSGVKGVALLTLTDTRTYTHTLSLSLSKTHTVSLKHAHTLTHTPIYTLTLKHTHTTVTHTHTYTLSQTHNKYTLLSHVNTLHTHTLNHIRSYTYTLPFSFSFKLTQTHTCNSLMHVSMFEKNANFLAKVLSLLFSALTKHSTFMTDSKFLSQTLLNDIRK